MLPPLHPTTLNPEKEKRAEWVAPEPVPDASEKRKICVVLVKI
jgi:hypothetical protein